MLLTVTKDTTHLGGQCLISTTLDSDGRIVHLGEAHIISACEVSTVGRPLTQETKFTCHNGV